MLNYYIVEIAGKQIKVEPGKEYLVNLLEDQKTFETDRVLAESEGTGLKIGTPYLKKTVKFEVLGTEKGKKIRVATFSAKANTRTVRGSRSKLSKVKLIVDSREKA